MSEQLVTEQSVITEPKRDLGFLQYHEQMRSKCSMSWKDEVEIDETEQREDAVERNQGQGAP